MKLNNKGFSIVELLVSFILITIIVSGMMIMVVQYERKATLSNIKLEMVKVKSDITRAIYDDIKNEDMVFNGFDTACGSDCINIVLNNSLKTLKLDRTNKYITYGDIDGKRIFYLQKNSSIGDFSVSQQDKVYKIALPIYNNDIEGDYGLDIVIVKE